jgi:hypothetical protein
MSMELPRWHLRKRLLREPCSTFLPAKYRRDLPAFGIAGRTWNVYLQRRPARRQGDSGKEKAAPPM